jgi:hypothetical protein
MSEHLVKYPLDDSETGDTIVSECTCEAEYCTASLAVKFGSEVRKGLHEMVGHPSNCHPRRNGLAISYLYCQLANRHKSHSTCCSSISKPRRVIPDTSSTPQPRHLDLETSHVSQPHRSSITSHKSIVFPPTAIFFMEFCCDSAPRSLVSQADSKTIGRVLLLT